MQIDTSQSSIHFSPRGNGGKIEMIVLHSTEGTRKSDIPILLGHTHRRVSAHYYIQRDGKVLQFVPDNQAAWHAGVSSWLGHSSGWIQSHSIGIELENLNRSDVAIRQPYPDVQYTATVELVRSLVQKYGIPSDNLVRHRDIAPLRKSDPAGFKWSQFRNDVFQGGNKPKTLIADPVPQTDTPEKPYENQDEITTNNSDWLDPMLEIEGKINTAAETAVSNAFTSFWVKLGEYWSRFLDGFKR